MSIYQHLDNDVKVYYLGYRREIEVRKRGTGELLLVAPSSEIPGIDHLSMRELTSAVLEMYGYQILQKLESKPSPTIPGSERYKVVNIHNGEVMATNDLDLLIEAVEDREDFRDAKNLVWVCSDKDSRHLIDQLVNKEDII